MFLKVQGVTGEAADADHKGEIQVVSWSWGMQAPRSALAGEATGRASMTELEIVKRVDNASPTLMLFLHRHKEIKQAKLTVRKAGKTPLEYFTIELQNARITSLRTETHESELTERLSLSFARVRVTYTLQDAAGGPGASNQFEVDAHAGL